MFKVPSELFPDLKSCLDQKLGSFEVCEFLNGQKKAKNPMSYFEFKGLKVASGYFWNVATKRDFVATFTKLQMPSAPQVSKI